MARWGKTKKPLERAIDPSFGRDLSADELEKFAAQLRAQHEADRRHRATVQRDRSEARRLRDEPGAG